MTVLLARHGETAWSRARRHTGRTDVPLLADGEEQARRLGACLAGRRFDAVFTSPLQRAARTCELAGYGDQAERLDDLMEWDYGTAEGRTTVEIRVERPGWSIWAEGPDGGEDIAAVAARADRVVERLLAVDGDVLVVSHAHLLRILATRWCEQDPALGRRLRLDPATQSELGWEHESRVILYWNAAP